MSCSIVDSLILNHGNEAPRASVLPVGPSIESMCDSKPSLMHRLRLVHPFDGVQQRGWSLPYYYVLMPQYLKADEGRSVTTNEEIASSCNPLHMQSIYAMSCHQDFPFFYSLNTELSIVCSRPLYRTFTRHADGM